MLLISKLLISKGYDVIISALDVTNPILSFDSIYVIDVVM